MKVDPAVFTVIVLFLAALWMLVVAVLLHR